MNWPMGWHRDCDGSIVWAEGQQYIRDGNAPGRVEVIKAYRHCGAFLTWAWAANLKPASAQDAADFIECTRSHNEACARRRESEAESIRANTRKWEARGAEPQPAPREE